MANEFHFACKKSEISDGQKLLVEVDESLVILFQVGDDYHAIDDVCTHDGGTLSDGELVGCEIECPRHGAKFDICSGKALTMPATQDTVAHKVKLEGDDVMVQLAES